MRQGCIFNVITYGSVVAFVNRPIPMIIRKRIEGYRIDYRCDNRSFWLSAHDCQVPTQTSENLENK